MCVCVCVCGGGGGVGFIEIKINIKHLSLMEPPTANNSFQYNLYAFFRWELLLLKCENLC